MSVVGSCAVAADVVVAYLHPGEVTYSFHSSLNRLVDYDRSRDPSEWRLGQWMAVSCGTGGLIEARNQTIRDFLEGPGEWLLIVDSDMGFQPDALDHLLAVADPEERPIVGGLCFAWKETTPDGVGGFRCSPRATIFDWVEREGQPSVFMGRSIYPVNAVVRCDATGAAFLLVHRNVLEQIRGEHGEHWFDRVPGSDGSLLGEDISFCLRAGALGIPLHVHTGVKTTHMKHLWVSEHDFWAAQVAPPATERTAVVVPVLHRPEHAEPFMASLRASTGLARAYAVVQVDDVEAAAAWEAAGAIVLEVEADVVSFAKKVNVGFRRTTQPWVFVVGSDVRFHPGWLDHAQHVGNTFDAGVVGTNDLGNPRVLAGEHATHFLMRRSYVEEHGGSWDEPGLVCHEGYRHWFVDDEIVTAAKQRGAWAMALGSVVEHLHPAWGKAAGDEVYDLGQSAAAQDQRTFVWRLKRNTAAAVRVA